MAKPKFAKGMNKVPGKGASANVEADKRALEYQPKRAGSGK